MDEDTCMVDFARFFISFLEDESCGKCTPCREGVEQMRRILEDLCAGRGEPKDLELLQDLAEVIRDASLCQLGATAPNPVLTTLNYFREEYESHVVDHRCPAGVCKALVTYSIEEAECNGCGLCRRNCPADAIIGETKKPHAIQADRCTKCGICYESCRFDAVVRN
jgi:Na+-translocating ferredoxin:NAD+ oxidoreductase RNF subunit RnfB